MIGFINLHPVIFLVAVRIYNVVNPRSQQLFYVASSVGRPLGICCLGQEGYSSLADTCLRMCLLGSPHLEAFIGSQGVELVKKYEILRIPIWCIMIRLYHLNR